MAVSAMSLGAQDFTTLSKDLGSPDWTVRAAAVGRLELLPDSIVPPAIRTQLVSLLEAEALKPVVPSPEGEAHGEYLSDLVHLVVGFRDPAAVRGIALLGIQTSKEAQAFLAEQVEAALPALDEAWQNVPDARDPVLETLGRMLVVSPANHLTQTQVQSILQRLLERSDSAPTGFYGAADYASLSDAVPVIQALLTKDPYPEVEQGLIARLSARRDATSPLDLVGHLRMWTAGFCAGATGSRRGTCESMDNLIADAESQLRAGRTEPARKTLDALAHRAATGRAGGALNQMEALLITANVGYLKGRL